MSFLICPVCKGALIKNEHTYSCGAGHSFDIAKEGYVNLLMSQASSQKRHGDDKLMVRSRRDFLDKGYYSALRDAVAEELALNTAPGAHIIDVGCGEGYYTELLEAVNNPVAVGIDISKDALKLASKRLKNTALCVASAFTLPCADSSADAVVNIFAPCAYGEFHRVLKENGVLIKAVPLAEHLWDLKCILYGEPYKNKPEQRDDALFELVDFKELKYTIALPCSEDIFALFTMTPYYYKTSAQDSERLLSETTLTTTVHFGVEVYKKR